MAYTYTVSRAFHMMKNSGAIMQSIYSSYKIVDNTLMEYDDNDEKWTKSQKVLPSELMESWIEIKNPAIEKSWNNL